MLDYLKKDTINLNCKIDNWKDAIAASGKLLYDYGVVEESYITSMIKMVEKHGPYIVVAPGIALAHARNEGNVKKNCISLVTINPPVEFGNEENDPVYIVFGICGVNNEDHLKIISGISNCFSNDKISHLIINSNSKEEVLSLLNNNQKGGKR